MLPMVVISNEYEIITGQRKWKAQGGIPNVHHRGLSLLDAAVPFIELQPLESGKETDYVKKR
jgi:hypothetical protein